MNDESWLALRIGTNGRSSTNSWPLSPGSCIIRYSGSIGLPDPESVEFRPPLSPPTGAAVAAAAVLDRVGARRDVPERRLLEELLRVGHVVQRVLLGLRVEDVFG